MWVYRGWGFFQKGNETKEDSRVGWKVGGKCRFEEFFHNMRVAEMKEWRVSQGW